MRVDGISLTEYVDGIWYSITLIKETEKAYLFQFYKLKNPDRPTRFWAPKSVVYDMQQGKTSLHVALPDWFSFADQITRSHLQQDVSDQFDEVK